MKKRIYLLYSLKYNDNVTTNRKLKIACLKDDIEKLRIYLIIVLTPLIYQ